MRIRLRLFGAAFVLVWFVWFAWDGLFARFRADDMMTMADYWTPGIAHSLLSNFMIGTNAYRPLGALFYLPLHAAFGLNPLAFRIVIFLLLGVNVYLAYRVALLLDCSDMASALVALLVCYHAGMGDLHYNTAVVYDILCFFFYSSTLIFYLNIRRQNRALTPLEWPLFLLLFLGALNSKEMAVTLPVMLLAYEWIYQKERQWWPALIVGLLTALSIFGKIFGSDPLMAQAAYKPVFTLTRYFQSSTVHLNDLLYTGFFFTPNRALLLWLVMGLIACRIRRSPLRFALLFIFISPLPVIFLEGRTRACLYIPLLGWAIFAGGARIRAERCTHPRGSAVGEPGGGMCCGGGAESDFDWHGAGGICSVWNS